MFIYHVMSMYPLTTSRHCKMEHRCVSVFRYPTCTNAVYFIFVQFVFGSSILDVYMDMSLSVPLKL